MGKALAEAFAAAREVFEEVDDALNQRLSRLMWEGPEGELTLTENTQPAVMTASIAVFRVLEKERRARPCQTRAARGRSLAGRIFGACARRAPSRSPIPRGCCGSAAARCRTRSPVGEGAMSALIGIEMDRVEEAVQGSVRGGRRRRRQRQRAGSDRDLRRSQGAVEKAGEIAKTKGAKRAIPLAVSTPNHSPLLKPAADTMRDALARSHDPAARRCRSSRTSPPAKSPSPTRSGACSSNSSPRACAGANRLRRSARSASP